MVDVSTLGSVFNIWTSRNGYKIDNTVNPFTYTTVPGWINCTSVTAASMQAVVVTTYTLVIVFQHRITKDTTM